MRIENFIVEDNDYIPPVVASEKGRVQTGAMHRCCRCLCRFKRNVNVLSSGRRLECPAKERKSRVHERFVHCVDKQPEYDRTREILSETGRTTKADACVGPPKTKYAH